MTDDEHIAQLQRLAYGADTPDSVRAQSAAELAELTGTGIRIGGSGRAAAITRDATEAVGSRPGPDGTTTALPPDLAGPGPGTLPGPAAGDAARPRARHWTAIAGIAGLLVGAAIGAAAGRVTPAEPRLTSADIAPAGPAFGSGEPGTPVRDTLLLRLFDRLPPVADTIEVERAAVQAIDPASVRLLASRTDGPAAYLARTSDGTDVCLILLLPPNDPPQGRCTTEGVMPVEGLRIYHAATTHGFVVAILNSSGTITLGLNAGR